MVNFVMKLYEYSAYSITIVFWLCLIGAIATKLIGRVTDGTQL